MNRRLVILTTHFGTNFSGGSTATCEILSRIENEFSEVIVIGTRLGNHPFKTLTFHPYKHWLHAIRLIRNLRNEDTLFYGDFYNTILFILARVPFFFTYHDNWPELSRDSLSNKMRGMFYWSVYKRIFKSAQAVVVVSKFKEQTVKKFTSRVSLIRNGVKERSHDSHDSQSASGFLMVGNIDDRKYKYAIPLFERMQNEERQIAVDIYGHPHQASLVKRLSSFEFINLKGFLNEIPYHTYRGLIHTSQMENLSLAWCDAINHDIPVVSFDVGGAKEIINETNGTLVAPFDIEQMTKSIYQLEGDRLSTDGRPRLSYEFSWDVASKKYLELFSSGNKN